MQHYRSIHYLRGMAALCIVVFHICIAVPAIDPGLKHTVWLESGVNIFFVISGFVMMKSTAHTPKTTGQFLLDRFIRIVPIYWIITLYIFASNPGLHRDMLLPSLFFVPVHTASGQLQSALIPPAWTLYIEFGFYVIFAFLIGFSQRKKLLYTALIFVAAIIIGKLVSSPTLSFYARPVIIEFWLGMMLACYHHHGRGWMLPLGVVLLTMAPAIPVPIISAYTIGAFLTVAGMVSLEEKFRDSTWMHALGDSSYVLYLTHMMTILIGLSLFGRQLQGQPALLFGALLLASIAVGWAVHRAVEKPLVKALKARGPVIADIAAKRLVQP